jgi:nucleoside-diphosphate-sugar epimerase
LKYTIIGHTGFVGKNFIQYTKSIESQLINRDLLASLNKNDIDPDSYAFINFVGKAHDLKKTLDSNEYYKTNTQLAKKIFDVFLESNAKVFITLSSVKAVADVLDYELNENYFPNPITHYGKSKLLAEQYILSKEIPKGKRVYILRPCMIHGPGNKGNLNLLYKIVSKALPWPLGAFENKRSFCSIDNLCFVINELIHNEQISSGLYNIADDEVFSTNELIRLIAESQGKKPLIFNTPKFLVKTLAKLGDLFGLPLNNERLSKLTESYIVSNQKIKNVLNKSLPVTAKEGLLRTFNSFNNAQ